MNNYKDILYTCGYIDGDGCFYLSYLNKRFRTNIIISSTNNILISYLTEIFQGTMRGYSRQNRNHKVIYEFRKLGNDSYGFAQIVLPYLVQKKKECELFISFFNEISKNEKLRIIQELQYQHKEADLISFDDIEKLKLIKSINPIEEDYIYMAGFIDAECNFTISKYKPKNRPNFVYKIILQLNDTKSPMFYWIKARFGGFCNFYKRTKGLKDQIIWRLTGKSLYPFLKKVHPYLRFKKPVCEKLIEFYETTLDNGGDRHSESFKNAYESIIIRRETIINEVHKLNSKGL